MTSWSATIQLKTTEQHFPVVLFIILCKGFLILSLWMKSLCVNYWEVLSWGTVHYGVQGAPTWDFLDEILDCDMQVKAAEHHFPTVLFVICRTALNLLLFYCQTSRTERREFLKNITAETGRPASAGCCGVCGRNRTICLIHIPYFLE